jgi:meiotically up-regulated gene 157 (Mug157) protein
VLIDPYANAFNAEPNGNGWHKDFKDQNPWVFERKYELDSLAAFIDLAVRLYRVTGYKDHLNARFWRAATLAVSIIEKELDHDRKSYRFVRRYAPKRDYLSHRGFGAPHAASVGLSWSAFRPSDDACKLPYLIPANAHAAVVLGQLAQVATAFGQVDLASKSATLGATIGAAVRKHGTMVREVGDVAGPIYAFEVDGNGGKILTEDPNVPSLLSLPYLGWCSPDDPTYLLTRKWILGRLNPRFIQGRFLAGLNSSHTPRKNIWPLALAIQGLTTADPDESARCLMLIETTDAGTGRVHESVNVNNPAKFTREWFSWADLTYVHLVLKVNGLSAKAD